jgi:hypothetical protein
MTDPKRTAATPRPDAKGPAPAGEQGPTPADDDERAGRLAQPRDPDPGTTPQEDEATDSVPATNPPHTPYDDLKLPHERDESAVGDARKGQDPVRTRRPIRQAHQDIVSGQEDTDCYDAVAPRFEAEEEDDRPGGERKRR